MRFLDAKVKSVKADLAAGTLTLSFTCRLSDHQGDAEELARFVGSEDSAVDLVVTPSQLPMFRTGERGQLEPVQAE